MDEPTAWINQAISDRDAAERLIFQGSVRCHAIAKCQQAVEKAIKAIVAILRDLGILNIEIGYRHEVDRFVNVLLRLPYRALNRDIQHRLHRFLDQDTRAGLKAIDSLVPRRPPPGENPRRNTEYPFLDATREWTSPAADGIFSQSEVEKFRKLAHRVIDQVGRIVQVIRRRPN